MDAILFRLKKANPDLFEPLVINIIKDYHDKEEEKRRIRELEIEKEKQARELRWREEKRLNACRYQSERACCGIAPLIMLLAIVFFIVAGVLNDTDFIKNRREIEKRIDFYCKTVPNPEMCEAAKKALEDYILKYSAKASERRKIAAIFVALGGVLTGICFIIFMWCCRYHKSLGEMRRNRQRVINGEYDMFDD